MFRFAKSKNNIRKVYVENAYIKYGFAHLGTATDFLRGESRP